jgi:5-methylthioribose kinase
MRTRTQSILTEAELPEFLAGLGLVPSGASLDVEPAGDGNINWVRRVRGPDGTSWIVKQARPNLERFPEYSAPTERIVCEHRWLEAAALHDPDGVCPEVVRFDEVDRVLVLADFGGAERLDHALARGATVTPALEAIARLLARVHAATSDPALAPDLRRRFDNDGMRRLHGDHIFVLPLRRNGFPLPPDLAARARELQADATLVAAADRAYARYLEPHGALVHADVQGGNVLLTRSGPKLLDAEIAHLGDPAFDVGTLVAHVLLAALGRRDLESAAADVDSIWSAYRAGGGPARHADVVRYAGLEILRRTIGAARVAAVADAEVGVAALDYARELVCNPPDAP